MVSSGVAQGDSHKMRHEDRLSFQGARHREDGVDRVRRAVSVAAVRPDVRFETQQPGTGTQALNVV